MRWSPDGKALIYKDSGPGHARSQYAGIVLLQSAKQIS